MLPPGRPIVPLEQSRAFQIRGASATGQPRRVRGAQRLRRPSMSCPVLHEGWLWLLTPAAAAVHTLLCCPPLTRLGARGGQRADQLADRLRGSGTVVGLALHDQVVAELDAHATAAHAQALRALRVAEHDDLDPAHVALVLKQLAVLGLAVEADGRWWCAASPLVSAPGGRRELPPVPLSAPWRHAATLAANALLKCWLRRTDRYSVPVWDLADPDGENADSARALLTDGLQAGRQMAALVGELVSTGERVDALAGPLVTLVPSELDGHDRESEPAPGRSSVKASLDLALTFRVQFARVRAAGWLGEPERDALAASAVATCDAATPAGQMVPAVLSVMPQAWRPMVGAHAERLQARGALGRALAQRSLVEFAADAGVAVHSDVRAVAALALRSEPVGYTSAASVLHECASPQSHVTPFGMSELAEDDSAQADAWLGLYERVLGAVGGMAEAGRRLQERTGLALGVDSAVAVGLRSRPSRTRRLRCRTPRRCRCCGSCGHGRP